MKCLWLLSLLVLLTGCAIEKNITITTNPEDALIKVNGAEIGHGSVLHRFIFQKPTDTITISVTHKGYQDKSITLTRDYLPSSIPVELKPFQRRLSIITTPVPAIISLDGKPVVGEPSAGISVDADFTVDGNDKWTTHVISAERRGYMRSEQVVQWGDQTSIYTLKLEPVRKDLNITTNPPGAEVLIDGQKVGVSPAKDAAHVYEYDTVANEYVPVVVKVTKPGFDPQERKIGWDEGKTDYQIDLIPKKKTVVVNTDPQGAAVQIEGANVVVTPDGKSTSDLEFPPINDQGELRTYSLKVSMNPVNGMEWYPTTTKLSWDEGKSSYDIKLMEVLTRPVDTTVVGLIRSNNAWEVKADSIKTICTKSIIEPEGNNQPQQLVKLDAGQTIGSLAVSPDGQNMVYTVQSNVNGLPASRMYMIRADGTGGSKSLSDGQSLDISPAYTPAGDGIIFSSNRAGKRLNIFKVASTGEGGVTRLTMSDTNDLNPSVDAEARPRLFYQAHVDTLPDARIFSTQMGTIFQTDLTKLSGTQPRIGPRNDAVIFCLMNEKTGKRDLARIPDKGGPADNLTNSPDADDIDPQWNSLGTKVAFASDRGTDAEKRNNYDIWVIDIANPSNIIRITTNGSVDDQPAWDPSDETIYFRSNRGGAWGIWKIKVNR